MPIENTLLEIVAIALVGGSSYAVSQFVTITPFDKTWNKDTNNLVFCAVPLAVYLIFRLYFALSFFLTSKIPASFKRIGIFFSFIILPSNHNFVFKSEQIANFVLVTAGISYAIYQPKVQSTFVSLYESYVGALPKIIYDLSKPEWEKAYAFGVKILMLLFGWFVLLFCLELVLRVVLLVVGFLVRSLTSRGAKAKKAQSAAAGDSGADKDKEE